MKYRLPPTNHSRTDNSDLAYVVLITVLWLMAWELTAQVKTSVSNGNWNNPATWSPSGVPASTDKIRIYHTVTLNQNFTAADTVFVSGVLNVSANCVLTLNPGTMILVNTAAYNGRLGAFGTGGNISGNFTFQKWITRCDGYSTYGSPFTVSTSNFNWYYCYQCMPSWSNIYYYNETIPGHKDLGFYDTIGGSIQRGRGFCYWYSNYAGGMNFSRQIALKGSINFTTDFNFNITKTTSTLSAADGFNLVANPFPGTIDWLSGAWTKKKIINAIYVWNSCTGSYASFAAGVGVNGGSRYIPSMQGFWVQGNSTNPQLKVGSGAMVAGSQNLLRSSSGNDAKNVLRLTLSNDEIAIRLDSASTQDTDSLTDAIKFFSPASAICSSVKNTTADYSINSVKDTDVVIPVKIKGGGVLGFSGLNTFSSGYSIYLKDLQTNASLQVTDGLQHSFQDTSRVTFQERFEIRFVQNRATGIRNQLVDKTQISYDNEKITIYVQDASELPANILLYDISGSLLYSGTLKQTETILPRNQVPAILRVYNHNGSVTKKIF